MKTLCIIVISFIAIADLIYIISEKRKEKNLQIRRYEKAYRHIQEFINMLEITPDNYDFLMRTFSNLNSLNYKNREKTSVLFVQFLKKFESVSKKRLIEEMNNN